MTAFPDYDAARIAALDAQAEAILGVFRSRSYERTDCAVLQPAEIFLDRAGEEIRRRTFVLADPAGRELCLRPDLTIPVCRAHLVAQRPFPARLCYNGLVFRHQPSEPDRPTQFYQAGVELLGDDNRAGAETEILSLAVEALRAAGLKDFSLRIGDLGLFNAFVDALDIPSPWRSRLKRHFWRTGYFEALLERLSKGAASDAQRLLAHLGTLDEAEARPAFEGLMDLLGGRIQGARTREEIVDRLIEQAADASALRLDAGIARSMAQFLAVSGGARESIAELASLAASAGALLDAPLAAMTRRMETLNALGIDESRVSFAARFGRNMEYYTGFVFELWARDSEGPVQIAGGGRYDTLLEQLGANHAIPAIGFVIRTERVLAARSVT